MKASERNDFAQSYNEEKLNRAEKLSDSHFEELHDLDNLLQTLDNLINTKVNGFRGVVATAITGLAINPNYDPINNFYGCNPRSIFEQGIFNAFRNRIPSGKSDPLNVAKNVNLLDDSWVSGKRPERAARAAVDYLTEIENAAPARRNLLIDLFYYKLVAYSQSRIAIIIEAPKREALSNQELAVICNTLINEYPESGTIPQFLIFKLLESVFKKSKISVEGGLESVFGTNTTSKKPSDIWLELNGNPINLFEITVKKIDRKRLNDCFDSLAELTLLGVPVQFICHFPKNTTELDDIVNSGIISQGKLFEFQDIGELVRSLCSMLSTNQISEVIRDANIFMKDIQRPVKTKEGWNKIVGSLPI